MKREREFMLWVECETKKQKKTSTKIHNFFQRASGERASSALLSLFSLVLLLQTHHTLALPLSRHAHAYR